MYGYNRLQCGFNPLLVNHRIEFSRGFKQLDQIKHVDFTLHYLGIKLLV